MIRVWNRVGGTISENRVKNARRIIGNSNLLSSDRGNIGNTEWDSSNMYVNISHQNAV